LKSFHHLYHEALVRRFNGNDEDLINFQARINLALAGIAGEQRVQRELIDCLQNDASIIAENIQFITDRNYPYQIDTLVFTEQFILLAEVKNITGILSYDPTLRQFSRIRADGKQENFPNPFDQLFRQYDFLTHLLKSKGFVIPIVPILINANNYATLHTSLRSQPIILVQSLRAKLAQLRQQYKERYPMDIIQSIHDYVMSQNTFYEANRYVSIHSLKRGVLCPHCNFKSTMHYESRTFCCPICLRTNRKALLLTLRDYRILVGPHINNSQFREWTGVSSCKTASKILARLNFDYVGSNRKRIYTVPQEYMFLDELG